MEKQTRKQFIRQAGLTGMALFLHQLKGFSEISSLNTPMANSDDVVYYGKNEVEYETLRKGFNRRINKYPKMIALCKTTRGVSAAILYAKANQLKVAVKSGGHCMEGFSSMDGGMVINLSLMNHIDWIDSNTLNVGPACLLKNIYESILPKGKYLPGGSCQTVAIGGLTLGGGYGLMSRKYGLTCDSLLEATVVMADGRVVNTKEDPELLWALKGGGNGNFGIVTQMKFALQKAPATMQSHQFRNKNCAIPQAIEICKKWFEWSAGLPVTCFSAFIFNGKTTYILLTNTGKSTPAIQSFIDCFSQLSTHVKAGNTLPFGRALKAYYGQATPLMFKNASAGLYKGYGDIASVINDVFTLVHQRPGIIYQINTLGGKIQSPEWQHLSSFAHRNCSYFSELQAYWQTEASSKSFLQEFDLIQQQFVKAGVKSQYRNYPDINFKDWASLYYGESLPRLLKIKNKYDPGHIFGGIQVLGN